MIYGINFNLQPIPAPAKRLFADRLKRHRVTGVLRAVGGDSSCDFILSGVCESKPELDQMLIQANNGHRQFHVVTRGSWIGVYCG